MQNGIEKILNASPKIPVVTFHQVEEVEKVLEQLIKQEVHCIEITLRTDAAIEAIQKCQALAPKDFAIGVGTIVEQKHVEICQELGVDFLVSPGANQGLIQSMQDSNIAFLPGVMTPSEILNAMQMDCAFLKLFPFNLAGGIKAIKTYGKVFPAVRFCPTGGVSAQNYQELLDLDNVISVGGSWLV